MFGFLLQWPTILTLAMFPVLVLMYGYLAKREGGRYGRSVWGMHIAITRRALRVSYPAFGAGT
jgi:hypothetical protein